MKEYTVAILNNGYFRWVKFTNGRKYITVKAATKPAALRKANCLVKQQPEVGSFSTEENTYNSVIVPGRVKINLD